MLHFWFVSKTNGILYFIWNYLIIIKIKPRKSSILAAAMEAKEK
jgi:hypothetical protein